MNDQLGGELLEELRQVRRLLQLIAEPAMAQRDAKLRDELRKIVRSSKKKQASVFLMNGSSTQTQIAEQTSIQRSHLSTMVGELEEAGLLSNDRKYPKLVIAIPPEVFDTDE